MPEMVPAVQAVLRGRRGVGAARHGRGADAIDRKQAISAFRAFFRRNSMSVVNISSSRVNPESEVEMVGRLAAGLTAWLPRARADEMSRAIADALGQVADA